MATPSAKVLIAFAAEVERLIDGSSEAADPPSAARRILADRMRDAQLDDEKLTACGLVLIDLLAQGWRVASAAARRKPPLWLRRPEHHASNMDVARADVKEQVKRQLMIARDEQLRRAGPRAFVEQMERRDGSTRGKRIFELMRDGRALVEAIEASLTAPPGEARRDALRGVIKPYIQVIADSEARCERTGFALQDIWRYFRYTWTTPAKSVPGRSMNVLIRDAAVDAHPIIGIAALSSAVVNLSTRDSAIGWAADEVVAELCEEATDKDARWLASLIQVGIEEIYTVDLIEDGILTTRALARPTDTVIARLVQDGEEARQEHLHHRGADRDHKRLDPATATPKQWREKARSSLFRSKRARRLATLLRARRLFTRYMGKEPSATGLAAILRTSEGRALTRSLILKAKADRVGICIADISVCGALPPYSDLLGGKLVSMLMTSPEVMAGYCQRYHDAVSVIASSMAGRAIRRQPTLVFLATTSLYGRSSQYNRLWMPLSHVGGKADERVAFKEVGLTEGTGTMQFSRDTVDALRALFKEGQLRVNYVFGEGVNPRMRLIREALATLQLDPDVLLAHGNPRSIFAVHLVRNTREFLLGLDAEPDWLIPQDDPAQRTEQIVDWWRERWLFNRVQKPEVLAKVAKHHSATVPRHHGAKVELPPDEDDQLGLFHDLGD